MFFRFVVLLAVTATLVGCSSRNRDVQNIGRLQQSVDSIFASAKVLTPEQRNKTNELISAYIEFVDKNPNDSLSAAYLFEAARLRTALPDMKGAIDLFYQVAEKFPQSEFAPRSLLSIGGIYDVTMADYENAREAYQTLMTQYPLQAEEYGVPVILRTLGKSPEEILMEIRGIGADSIDISQAVPTADQK